MERMAYAVTCGYERRRPEARGPPGDLEMVQGMLRCEWGSNTTVQRLQ